MEFWLRLTNFRKINVKIGENKNKYFFMRVWESSIIIACVYSSFFLSPWPWTGFFTKWNPFFGIGIILFRFYKFIFMLYAWLHDVITVFIPYVFGFFSKFYFSHNTFLGVFRAGESESISDFDLTLLYQDMSIFTKEMSTFFKTLQLVLLV